MKKLLIGLVCGWSALASAQDLPLNTIPLGKGPGVVGFGYAGPCPVGQGLFYLNGPTQPPSCFNPGGGSGTVNSVSVITANGLGGTVSAPTSNPAITLNTNVVGIVSGNGVGFTNATIDPTLTYNAITNTLSCTQAVVSPQQNGCLAPDGVTIKETAGGQISAQSLNNFIDLQSVYKADPTGNTDICGTPYNAATGFGALQAAITAQQATGLGGTIFLGDGTFLDNNGCTIATGGIKILGNSWEPWTSSFVLGKHGTYINTTSVSNTPFTITGNGSSISDIAFLQNQGSDRNGFSPTVYPSTIVVGSNSGGGFDTRLDNLFFWNVYNAIQLGGSTPNALCNNCTGRVTINNIFGNPLNIGIEIIGANDIVRINNVHFWPYFSNSVGGFSTGALYYTYQNSTGIYSARNDTPMMSNIFVFGYSDVMYFDNNTSGATQNGTFNNIVGDSVQRGFIFNGGSQLQNQFTNINLGVFCPNITCSEAGAAILVNNVAGTYHDSFTNTVFSAGTSVLQMLNATSGTGDWAFTNSDWNFNNFNGSSSTSYSITAGAENTVTVSGRYVSIGAGSSSGNTTTGAFTFNVYQGGGGSGTVNSGTASLLTYYATTGTTVSAIPSIAYLLTGSVTQLFVGNAGGGGQQGQVVVRSPNGGAVGLSAPQSGSASYSMYFPPTVGANGNLLTTDGSGNSSWETSLVLGNVGGVGSIAGVTSSSASFWAFASYYSPASSSGAYLARIDSTSASFMGMDFAGSIIGSIGSTTGTSTQYNTTSDARLKNVVGEIDPDPIFDNVYPVEFTWKSSGKHDVGFIAQDVQPWAPNAVTEGHGEPGDSDFIPWQLDYSKLVPYIWAEVSKLRNEVEKR